MRGPPVCPLNESHGLGLQHNTQNPPSIHHPTIRIAVARVPPLRGHSDEVDDAYDLCRLPYPPPIPRNHAGAAGTERTQQGGGGDGSSSGQQQQWHAVGTACARVWARQGEGVPAAAQGVFSGGRQGWAAVGRKGGEVLVESGSGAAWRPIRWLPLQAKPWLNKI